jgi:hypothetical protein
MVTIHNADEICSNPLRSHPITLGRATSDGMGLNEKRESRPDHQSIRLVRFGEGGLKKPTEV